MLGIALIHGIPAIPMSSLGGRIVGRNTGRWPVHQQVICRLLLS